MNRFEQVRTGVKYYVFFCFFFHTLISNCLEHEYTQESTAFAQSSEDERTGIAGKEEQEEHEE